MANYLYAVKDKTNLCKSRDYCMLTLDGRSLYSNETADDLVKLGYEILDAKGFDELWNQCWEVYENELCDKWKEITAERYDEMLNCLPPMRWTNGGFFLSELYDGDIGSFFQEWGNRYYESMQNIKKSRKDIIDSLKESIRNGSILPLDDSEA